MVMMMMMARFKLFQLSFSAIDSLSPYHAAGLDWAWRAFVLSFCKALLASIFSSVSHLVCAGMLVCD